MTDAQFKRYMELWSKMEATKDAKGRTYTDTADLSPSELYEFRSLSRLNEAMQAKYHEEQLERMNRAQLSHFMPHDPPTFDGAW